MSRKHIQVDPEHYQTPTRVNPVGGHYNPYSSYSQESDNPYVHRPESQAIYGSYGEYKEGCPMCEEDPVWQCDCIHKDKKCRNGHVWYNDREGVPQLRNPHEKATNKKKEERPTQNPEPEPGRTSNPALKVNTPYGEML